MLSLIIVALSASAPAQAADWATSSCPPAEAARYLAERSNKPAKLNDAGLYAYRARLPGVLARSSGGGAKQWEVQVQVQVRPGPSGGSEVGFGLKSVGKITERMIGPAKEWKATELSALKRHCSSKDWDARATKSSEAKGESDRSRCTLMGGEARSAPLKRLYVGNDMSWQGGALETGHTRFTLDYPLTVSACTLDGRTLTGPLSAKQRGSDPSLTATLRDGQLHGELTLRHHDTGGILRTVTYSDGREQGLLQEFEADGSEAPLRAVLYEKGEQVACSGACLQPPYAELPRVPPELGQLYPQHQEFLSAMGSVEDAQRTRLEADAARQRAFAQERSRQDAARLARSQEAGSSVAGGFVVLYLSSVCDNVRLENLSLSKDGWYRAVGTGTCPQRIYIGGDAKTLMVRMRFVLQLSPGEDGAWVTRWGANWSDW